MPLSPLNHVSKRSPWRLSSVGPQPWASYQIHEIAGCACAGNAGNVFPATDFRKPPVSYPGMHHGTCVTHVPWCMSGSLTRGGEENVPAIPGACAIHNFMYMSKGPWWHKERLLDDEQWRVFIFLSMFSHNRATLCHVYMTVDVTCSFIGPGWNGRQSADDGSDFIFLNTNVESNWTQFAFWVQSISNSHWHLKQMAWHRTSNNPFTEPMMSQSLTHV